MHKRLLLALLLLLALATLGARAEQSTTTLMVYICGTDLQDAACEDLLEMAEVEAGDAINLVVLAGGASEWDLEDLEPNTRNLAVIRDGYFEELEDWGQKSMGDPDSLYEFLEYGMSAYPADRTIVVLWNHGAGSEGGICFDETAHDDSLTLVEIDETLARLKRESGDFHIDIFGCDACMMATYEMAAMLANYDIDYFVASEELEPGIGWYYTPWLECIAEDAEISNEELCREIVESFMEAGLDSDPDDYLTLSAVRLSEVKALEQIMERFAAVMTDSLQSGGLATVRRGRSRMYTFGSFADGSWDMVDLGAMLDAYARFDPDLAAEAKRCLSQAVLISRQTDNLNACCGLSILLPQDTTDTFDTYSEGFNLEERIPNWVEFVNGYVTMLQGGHYQFNISSTEQVGDIQTLISAFTSAFLDPGEGMQWNEDEENYEDAEAEEPEIPIDDSDYGFSATIPREELDYLDYVEGMLLVRVVDGDMEFYVDFGLMRNNRVDWDTGTVYSLFDGTWPVFGEQMVPLYDQISNGRGRRSLIPVKLNGEYTYLLVAFEADGTEGRILGANAGYDENGLPVRETTRLKPGDVIVPVYTMYIEQDDDLEEMESDGDEIVWQEGMTVCYEELGDDGEPMEALFSFVFNDIFGKYTMSEMIAFDI